MKRPNYLFLLTLIFSLFTCSVISQNCQVCTYTIIDVDTNTYILDSGKTLCIANTGIIKGKIILNGGVLCNSGIFHPKILTYANGDFENYGTFYPYKIRLKGNSRFINHQGGELRQPDIQAAEKAIFIDETINE